MYDPVSVSVTTASSNAFFSAGIQVRIHKVSLSQVDGSAAHSVLLFDAATAAGTATIRLDANVTGAAGTFEKYSEANFNPPVFHGVGLSTTLAGSNTCRIYYTRV